MIDQIKILHIIPAYGGGISSFVKNLVCVNAEDDFKMDITGFGIFPEHFVNAVNSYGGNIYPLVNSHKHFLKFLIQFSNILKNNKYNVVHCHFSGLKGLCFKLLARLYGVKIIAQHAHRSDDENKKVFYTFSRLISRIASVVCVDIYFTCSDLASNHIYGEKFACKHEITMLPNTIDLALYEATITSKEMNTLKDSLNIKKDSFIVCHIGRFNKVKNHVFILDMIKKLSQKTNNFVVLLVGDGDDYEKIKAIAKENQIEKYIRFTGKRTDVPKILEISNMFILPSLHEGLPTVAVESQAAGLVTLLSDTITKQADLGMGLVSYLPIDSGSEVWCDKILNYMNRPINAMTFQERKVILKNKGFTNEELRRKYTNELKKIVQERNNNEI